MPQVGRATLGSPQEVNEQRPDGNGSFGDAHHVLFYGGWPNVFSAVPVPTGVVRETSQIECPTRLLAISVCAVLIDGSRGFADRSIKNEDFGVAGFRLLEPPILVSRITARRGTFKEYLGVPGSGPYAAGAVGIQKSENRLFWRC